MGFNAWRGVSVLVFTGAALIGCNNGQKDKAVADNKQKAPPTVAQTNQTPSPWSTAGQPAPFPTNPSAQAKAPQQPLNPSPSNPPFGAQNNPFGPSPTASNNPAGVGAGPDLKNLPSLPNQSSNNVIPTSGPGNPSFAPTFPPTQNMPPMPTPPAPPSGGFGDMRPPTPNTGALPAPGQPFNPLPPPPPARP
jgi:hypothetical protein